MRSLLIISPELTGQVVPKNSYGSDMRYYVHAAIATYEVIFAQLTPAHGSASEIRNAPERVLKTGWTWMAIETPAVLRQFREREAPRLEQLHAREIMKHTRSRLSSRLVFGLITRTLLSKSCNL